MNMNSVDIAFRDYAFVRSSLLERREIALLDVREEDPHAQAHPLFAANFPLSRLELDAYAKLPRRDVPVVTFDAGAGDPDAMVAAVRLRALGYTDVSVFRDGLRGWIAAGGEVFRDVNVPSKSFGELVESMRHTPSLCAEDVQALIDAKADIVIVDARRFDEYQTMSIPTAVSCPGAELVLRVPDLAPRPETRVIVNCAGRTRSIIGTQSLINAGLPNPVSALRNGTIGWTLAGQALDKGQQRQAGAPAESTVALASRRARDVADRAGVGRATLADALAWHAQEGRTTYLFDARSPQEFDAGHLPGFRSTPGGQLVQETEMVAPVRGARILLVDTDGVRANMTASWLAQMAWDVHVLEGVTSADFRQRGAWRAPLPPLPARRTITVDALDAALSAPAGVLVIDLSRHAQYVQGHIPGAWYALRSHLRQALGGMPRAPRVVITCPDGLLSSFAAPDVSVAIGREVEVLEGGMQAWRAAGHALEQGPTHLASPPLDRYKRPYEGTDSAREAMQGYLDWEFGLVEQLGRDGTHHFRVI